MMNINVVCNFIRDTESDTRHLLERYFIENSNLLDSIYFIPKKMNKENIYMKLSNEDYIEKIDSIRKLYNSINLESFINNAISSFLLETKQSIDSQEVYIIIGLESTTIYSTKYNDKNVTIILLESAISLDYLVMLLAHEFTHWVRAKYINHDIFETCIGERFITEGIACAYSKEKVPNKNTHEYCIVPESTVKWCEDNIEKLDRLVIDKLDDKDDMAKYFYMFAKIDIPVRTGYVYGYLKVIDYLAKNKENIKDILTINWKDIFNCK